MALDVVVIQIENPGNLGAIARAMANFGMKNLVLIDPQCSLTDEAARCRAKHAQDVLLHAHIGGFELLDSYDYLVATTAKFGMYYNLARSPMTPSEFAAKVSSIQRRKIGLVIGRESSGLTNAEIGRCDFVVTIPGSRYNTLNISHACAILFYELFKTKGTEQLHERFIPINKKEKEHLLKRIDQLIDSIEFATEEKKETQRLAWRRILGKAMLTKREAFTLFGLLKKLVK